MNAIVERDAMGNMQLRPRPIESAESTSLMAVISRAASDPATDVTKLERLMAMYERITAGQAKAAYAAALAAMQPEMPVIVERGVIDIGRGKPQSYARWEDINEGIKPVLAKHAFALSFRTGREADKIIVTGILSHAGGHAEETTMHLPIDTTGSKNAVQSVGSSTSYGKRYTASALLNLTSRAVEDRDDGAAGNGAKIADEEMQTLRDKLRLVGADIAKFCEFFKIVDLSQLPAGALEEATKMVERKAAEKSKAAKP